ncbi:hypothetical protein GN958_ATG02567 [Phytophthora infestans]|uniref:Uncharacterized protein n=1 Tax=Phytophthora infestans TaxID=4787 RepID=A0A8S9V6W1_PHYIN|nr:hypothetical protein GN958_ATG02567 [Phytophthora infestans]
MRAQQHLPQPTPTGNERSAHRSSEGSAVAILAPTGSTDTQQTADEPQHSAWPPEQSELYGVDDIAKIPACIRSAVLEFRPTPTSTTSNHRSITFKYGARVNYVFRGTPVVEWLCMASDACRRKCSCTETARKRSREEEVNRILASALCREDTKRLSVLLETIRLMFNNLPFRFGE